MPPFSRDLRERELRRHTRILLHSALPEEPCFRVGLLNTHLPRPSKALPNLTRSANADTSPSPSAKHEELCDIPGVRRAGNPRPLLYQDEPGELAVGPNQERKPMRLLPIERERRVAESAVRSDPDIGKLAKIMGVELE